MNITLTVCYVNYKLFFRQDTSIKTITFSKFKSDLKLNLEL